MTTADDRFMEGGRMALQPIGGSGPSLADEAYRRLSAALLAGDLPPGSRLVMDTLAERLGISRTPVRDALRRMEREGLVEPTGRKGYTVRAIVYSDIVHFYESRIAIEAYSAYRVAELGERAISEVERAVQAAIETSPRAAPEVFSQNRAIHRAVVEAVGNPIIVDLFDDVWGRARSMQFFEQFLRSPASTIDNDNLAGHFELTEAMRAGPEQAREAMCQHVKHGLSAHRTEQGESVGPQRSAH